MKMNKIKLLSLITLSAIATISITYWNQNSTFSWENLSWWKAKIKNMKMMQESRKEARNEMKPKFEEAKNMFSWNRAAIHANWSWVRDEFGYLRTYLKTDLTVEQKQSILSWHKIKMEEIKLILSGMNLENYTWVKAQLMDLHAKAFDALLPYIAEDKIDAYNAYKAKAIEMIWKNLDLRIKNFSARKEFMNQHKRLLTEKMSWKLNSQVNKIPQDKKEIVLKKMIEKVNKQIENIENSQMKEPNKGLVINALKEIILILENEILQLENN